MYLSRRALLGSALASFVSFTGRADEPPRIIAAAKARLRLVPEPAPDTLVGGFEAEVPGPLLRCKMGEGFKIRIVNRCDESLTFACQGMRLDNPMDGVAGLTQAPILPGQSFDYRIESPNAGFYFYRSLVAPRACEQLRQGFYGAFIVDEADALATDRDIVTVLADWRLDADAQVFAGSAGGPYPLTTINSKPVPLSEILPPRSRVRLRLLNAVSDRVMFIAFDGLKPLVLGIDSAPCEAFAPLQDTLPIAPGARFDVMFDLPAEAGLAAQLVLRSPGEPDQPLLIFKTEGQSRKDLPPIGSLPPNPLLPVAINLRASRKLDLTIGGGPKGATATDPPGPFLLNGIAAGDFGPKPFFSVARGTPVTLGLVNKTPFVQQVLFHGHHLRLLHDLDDGWEPYWRDNVIIPGGRKKHVAFVADNPGKWAIECLPLYPQSALLVAWFEVT
jgi:FtsP/CotA-like multicopper oxidase with cupredoxin domain